MMAHLLIETAREALEPVIIELIKDGKLGPNRETQHALNRSASDLLFFSAMPLVSNGGDWDSRMILWLDDAGSTHGFFPIQPTGQLDAWHPISDDCGSTG